MLWLRQNQSDIFSGSLTGCSSTKAILEELGNQGEGCEWSCKSEPLSWVV